MKKKLLSLTGIMFTIITLSNTCKKEDNDHVLTLLLAGLTNESAAVNIFSEGCPEATLKVDNSKIPIDGSFPSVESAMAAAPSIEESCELLTIEIHTSALYESIVVGDRPLRLVGKAEATMVNGSISNPIGQELQLEDFKIRYAQKFGVDQVGGKLKISSIKVEYVVADPLDPQTGVGVRIGNGAVAHIVDLDLNNNDAGGLRIEGQSTRAIASSVVLTDNQMHPLEIPEAMPVYFGAVQVRDGAHASFTILILEGNYGYGMTVTEGARARVHLGSSNNVMGLPIYLGGSIDGVAHILVRDLSTLQISDFSISNSLDKTTTFVVGQMIWDSYWTAESLNISGHTIGLVAVGWWEQVLQETPDYSLFGCMKNVFLFNNDRNYDGYLLPVPVAILPGEETEAITFPETYCKTVEIPTLY